MLLCLVCPHAQARTNYGDGRGGTGQCTKGPSGWMVASGGICTLNFHNELLPIYAVEFPVKPQHGVIASAERYQVAYRAASGYKGPDYFEIRLIVQRAGKPSQIVKRIHVTVY